MKFDAMHSPTKTLTCLRLSALVKSHPYDVYASSYRTNGFELAVPARLP